MVLSSAKRIFSSILLKMTFFLEKYKKALGVFYISARKKRRMYEIFLKTRLLVVLWADFRLSVSNPKGLMVLNLWYLEEEYIKKKLYFHLTYQFTAGDTSFPLIKQKCRKSSGF